MATTLSVKTFFEKQATDSLRADQPMDSGYNWTLLDNVAHLIDECGKYRINWLARNNTTYDGAVLDDAHVAFLDADGVWYTLIPTQIVVNNQYPRYDIRIYTTRGVDDATVRVSLVTPGVTAPVTSADQQGVIGTFDTTWDVSESPTAIAQGLILSKSAESAPFYTMQAPHYPGTEDSIGTIVLVKLIVELLDPPLPSEGLPIIVGVQLREYLR